MEKVLKISEYKATITYPILVKTTRHGNPEKVEFCYKAQWLLEIPPGLNSHCACLCVRARVVA